MSNYTKPSNEYLVYSRDSLTFKIMIKHRKITILLASFVFAFLVSFGSFPYAHGAENAGAPDQRYTKIRLISEKTTIGPNEEIWIGVEYSIHPDWHIYWQNPGDSGAAANHIWDLPPGFEISDIQWPVPQKIPYPPLLNYGYSDNVVLLHKLKAPDTYPEGPLTLTADIDVLVCDEICIPEYDTLSLTLNSPDDIPSDNAGFFAKVTKNLPQRRDIQAQFDFNHETFQIRIPEISNTIENIAETDLTFFPIDWGVVQNAASSTVTIEDDTLTITQPRGDRNIDDLKTLNAVLTYKTPDGGRRGIELSADKSNLDLPPPSQETGGTANSDGLSLSSDEGQSPSTDRMFDTASTGLALALVFAFLGGVVLNLMPCVFPVLSLKALSLCKMADHDQTGLARLHGLAYTAGVILSFLIIAAILIALQAAGSQIGWGFQLQNPLIVALLAYLLFAIGLNLIGFFEIGNRIGNIGSNLTAGHNVSSSFFTGILATIVATPCTAPFMGVAIGYALLQPPAVSLLIFAVLGLGLAFPYLLLAFIPKLQSLLPRPGTWMIIFKQALAFPMFGFAIWLIWILSQQTGSYALFGVLLGLLCISFAAWLLHILPVEGWKRRLVQILALISFILAVVFLPYPSTQPLPVMTQQGSSHSLSNSDSDGNKTGAKDAHTAMDIQAFTPNTLEGALQTDRPVFVEMTAAWCITCKINNATSLNIKATKQVFQDNNVLYMIGDWTNYNADITSYLESFNRNGVPLYVFYPAPNPDNGERPEPQILPQILTPGIVANTINPA